MFLQYGSDYHLDVYTNSEDISEYINPSADTFVLLGDICNFNPPIFRKSLKWLSSNFEKIYYVLGNHEFYNSSIPKTYECFEEILETENINNVDILRNKKVENFYGGTLWVDLEKYKRLPTAFLMNDHKVIKDFFNTVEICRYEFLKGLENSTIDVMFTHYPPLRLDVLDEVYAKRFGRTNLNDFFVNDSILHNVSNPPKLCMFGHTHYTCDLNVNGVRYISNPLGHRSNPISLNEKYDKAKVIEIESFKFQRPSRSR